MNEYILNTHLLTKQESLELVKYGLLAQTADFIIIEGPGKSIKVKYIDDDPGMKDLLKTMKFDESSPFIPIWSTSRLIELLVLEFSTDYHVTYDDHRSLNIKDDVYSKLLEGLKVGRGNFKLEGD